MKAIVNGRLIVPGVDGGFIVRDDLVLVFDELIRGLVPTGEFDVGGDCELIDAEGLFVSPGFINVHIHGCNNADVMDENDSALDTISRFQAATGVTAFLPTTMTYDWPRIEGALERIRQAKSRDTGGAKVLGCHMEGPFISPKYRGSQAAKNIQKADFSLIAPYSDVVRIVTIAPEEVPPDFIAACRDAGIILSLGHSAADYDTAMGAIQAGASHITHLFNGMTGLHHRSPGVAAAALVSCAMTEIIADNVHVHPAMQQLVYRLKAPRNKLVLVTDSCRACGMPDGESELGGQRIIVKDGRATLEDGTIAASTCTLDQAMGNFLANTDATLEQVVEAVTRNPAAELGLTEKIGLIAPGRQADFAIFDEKIQVKQTIINGHTV